MIEENKRNLREQFALSSSFNEHNRSRVYSNISNDSSRKAMIYDRKSSNYNRMKYYSALRTAMFNSGGEDLLDVP